MCPDEVGKKEKGFMTEAPQQSIEYFTTYEAREDAFRARVNALIPRKYGGPALFWEDFGHVSFDRLYGTNGDHQAYITSNPRDCLAFGTPRQVLSASRMRAGGSVGDRSLSVENVAEHFAISATLNQPIRSLSGGETVKLSMAKSFIDAGHSRQLTISSPFSWLSYNNAVYFERLCRRYQTMGIPVEILALDGEDSHTVIGENDPLVEPRQRNVEFHLGLEKVRIPLGTFFHDLQGQRPQAEVAEFESRLKSPCLLTGGNGQGKSLVAKVLAGAIDYSGNAQITNRGGSGRARLLFQDVVTQTLLRSFEGLAAPSSPESTVSTLDLYHRIIRHFTDAFASRDKPVPLTDGNRLPSLLEIKAMLIAARLGSRSKALIMDEPDWGLTRESSVALVSATVTVAHALGIPVVLISHKPWWESVAGSILKVARSDAGPDGSFQIRLGYREKMTS